MYLKANQSDHFYKNKYTNTHQARVRHRPSSGADGKAFCIIIRINISTDGQSLHFQ